jgi:LysM repeat protein
MAPQATTQAEVIAEPEDDIEAVRTQMDRELGIGGSEPVASVEAEPAVEQLEEAVVETVEESQPVADADIEVADDIVVPEDVSDSGQMNEAEPQDLESIRAQMDKTLGIDGAEPIENVDNSDSEVVAESEVYTEASVAGEHVVVAGDTLYSIAKPASQSNSVSVNQMMVAIQQANPREKLSV